MTDDPLLKPKDAAARLGVTAETIRRWIRKKAIPYVELGPNRRKRIRQSVVDAQRVDVFHAEQSRT
jgi:excisionase family DNA binding protein